MPAAQSDAGEGRRPTLGLLAAAAALAVIALLPPAEGLPLEGQRLAAVFALAVVLWVTEALPIAVTSLLVLVLQPLLGAAPLRTAFQGFVTPVFFFVLAMFLLAAAILRSGLDRRFAYWLLERAGSDARRTVAALMLGTAAFSTLLSDVPATAIFMAVGLGVLARAGVGRGSSFARAVMVGIPIASLVGGVATPAGSSINVLGMHFIEQHGGVRVSFLDWMVLGVPMVLLLVPASIALVLWFFPPEMERLQGHEELARERAALGPLGAQEKKAIALVAGMVALWVAGSWVERLDVVMVALVGSVAMFLPGIGLLDWATARERIGWDTLLLIGGVTSLGSASVDTGLAGWLVQALLGGVSAWSPMALVAAISAFTVLIHLALPIGPVINAVLIPPIVVLAQQAGANPAVYALPVAFSASASFLLPIDPVPALTYAHGYYRMKDMLIPGLVLGAIWVAWLTPLAVWLGPILLG